jgi:acyl-coenzyme A thioesterase PaaI-like protein
MTRPWSAAQAEWHAFSMSTDRIRLNANETPHCFGCGPANPRGLQLEIFQDGTDAVATFTPTPDLGGWPDRLHGGVIGLLVDEMLVYAGAPHDLWGVTAKVRYWLRKPIAFGDELTLRSRLIQQSERAFRATVAIHLPGEVLAAEGEGMCVLRRAPDED